MANSSMYGENPTPENYRDIDLLVSTAETAANTAIANGNSATAAAAAAQSSATNAANSASSSAGSASAAAVSQAEALASKNAAASSATNAANSATAASTSANTATSQATNAANSATAAGASANAANNAATSSVTNASAAASSATSAATSATNAAASATSASGSASSASTSASNAASSASTASSAASTATTKASDAATSATNAATSATNAANSATSASGSATTATTQASAASTSASNAATSATNAANSASAAATSASNAASSASNTAALLASFRGVYLGAFASDSAAVAFANANSISVVNGIMYENTTSTKFRIYNGTAWQDYDSSAQASQSAAALSAANAATSASSASTSASNAATSATNAANSATSASTSATNAANSATSASGSASTATTQATNATNSATSAATSATNAANSATTVANSLTNYYDKTTSDARFAPISHTHPASQISDSSAVGRALLTAADVATQRTYLGLGSAALSATTAFVNVTATTGAASLPAGTTAQRPGSPSAGAIRYNSSTGKFEGYGASWGNIGGGATISDTAPSNAAAGDLWWRSSEGVLYVYYTDADSSQWVTANPDGAGMYLPITGGTVTGDITMSGTGQLKLPAGTTGQRTGTPVAGMIRFNSTNNQFEGYNGTAWSTVGGGANVLQSGTAQNTTSGTTITFTGIPSTAKRITILFNGVSTSGSSNPTIRLGSGSVQSTGYSGATTSTVSSNQVSGVQYSSGFEIQSQFGNADTYSGVVTFTNLSSNIWIASGVLALSNSIRTFEIGGTVTLTGTLDRVVLTTVNGTDTFDAGSVNIIYE